MQGTFLCGPWQFPCALGRGGLRASKQEGDGATPIGTFALRSGFFRADRLGAVATAGLLLRPTSQADAWCESPTCDQYNALVHLPHEGADPLWREDAVYDVVVPLGYNDAPVVAGAGSAIFLHVARPGYTPTAGCVALALPDLLQVLAFCTASTRLVIERVAERAVVRVV